MQALVISGSTNNIDFKGIANDVFSDKGVQLYNFQLGPDVEFKEVLFMAVQDSSGNKLDYINISLTTDDVKYYDSADYYLGLDKSPANDSTFNMMGGYFIPTQIGPFQIYEHPTPPAFVSLIKNPAYGCGIFVAFYTDFEERMKRRDAIKKAFEDDPPDSIKIKPGF